MVAIGKHVQDKPASRLVFGQAMMADEAEKAGAALAATRIFLSASRSARVPSPQESARWLGQ